MTFRENIEINNPEAISCFEKEEEEVTDKYKNDAAFKETVKGLENIAKTIGFNGIRVRENGEKIEIGFYKTYEAEVTEDDNTTREEIGIYKDKRGKVIIGEKILRNIKDLFEIDEEFAKNGLTIFIEHEAEHLKSNAGKVLGKMDAEMEKTASTEQIKDYNDLSDRMEKINKQYYSPAERQAELQRINSGYKDLDGFIESQAKLYLTDRIIRRGVGVLEDNKLPVELKQLIEQYPGADFIREDLQEKIVKRAEKMRQDLALKRAENFDSEKEAERVISREILDRLGIANSEYAKNYSKEIDFLTDIARSSNFKGVLISKKLKDMSVHDAKDLNDYFLFPGKGLENQKILMRIKKDLAINGAQRVMCHEKHHCKGPAKKLGDDRSIKMDEDEKMVDIENQVNLQTLCQNPEVENKDDVIKNIAEENVYAHFIYRGVDELNRKTNEDYYNKIYKFLKPDIAKQIVDKENAIKKELLEKLVQETENIKEINENNEIDREKETTVNEQLVEAYNVFQKELPGNYETVYYPCSAKDVSPSRSFSSSKVLYIDLDQKAVETLKKEGFEAYYEDAVEHCNKEENKESADVIIIMNPRISGLDLINCLKKGGYVLCNDYHRTATEFKESLDFELLGIIRKSDNKIIFDKENPTDYWETIDNEKDFKKAPFGFGQMNYNGAKDIIKRIKGEEPKEVLSEYKKILKQEIDKMSEEKKDFIRETGTITVKDAKGEQLLLLTELPRKKGTCDDVFVFKRK